VQKTNVTESDVHDEFAEVATIIIPRIVAKGRLKRNKSYMLFSVTCMPLSSLELNSVLIGARI